MGFALWVGRVEYEDPVGAMQITTWEGHSTGLDELRKVEQADGIHSAMTMGCDHSSAVPICLMCIQIAAIGREGARA